MTERIKKVAGAALVAAAALMPMACSSDAAVVSENLSRAADQFEITRRVVFLNGITDTYFLEIIGRCSIEDEGHQLEVTCEVEPGQYRKHFLGLSDNVSYFVEQLNPANVSAHHYRVVFKPQEIIPDIDLVADTGDLPRAQP